MRIGACHCSTWQAVKCAPGSLAAPEVFSERELFCFFDHFTPRLCDLVACEEKKKSVCRATMFIEELSIECFDAARFT